MNNEESDKDDGILNESIKINKKANSLKKINW